MSKAMLAAIKRKREQMGSHEATHKGKADEDKLDSEKIEAKEEQKDRSTDILKGKPSTEEKKKIEQRAMEEQSEGEDDVDSDAIAMDMLDSRFKNNAPSKPRNLHERVQMGMAQNLKSKGKI